MKAFIDRFLGDVKQIVSTHSADASLLERKLNYAKEYHLKGLSPASASPEMEEELNRICEQILGEFDNRK